jgi:hypothetical protein
MKMVMQKNMMNGALALLLLTTAGGALAQAAPGAAVSEAAAAADAAGAASTPVRVIAGVRSVPEADDRLADVKQQRAVIEASFADSERYCYTKFFVNYCLDKAKEIRRAGLAEIRPVEIDASHFKRADAVAKRDAALAVDAQKAAELAEARNAAPVPVTDVKPAPAAKTASGPTQAQREAAQRAKLQRAQAEQDANADQRARNADAYVKRQQESVKKQQSIADKAAAREQKNRQRAADKAARDAAAAAAAAASKP